MAKAMVPSRLICACVRLGVGAGDGLHPGHRRDLGQRLRHRGPDRGRPDGGAVGGLDDDLVALARRGREVLRQQADRRLRIGVRQAEARAEIGARRPAEPDHGDHGEQPGRRHPPSMLEAPASQSGHEKNLRVMTSGSVFRTRDQHCWRAASRPRGSARPNRGCSGLHHRRGARSPARVPAAALSLMACGRRCGERGGPRSSWPWPSG